MSYFAFSRLVVVVCGLFCWAILRLMDYIVIFGKNILDMKKFGFLQCFLLAEVIKKMDVWSVGFPILSKHPFYQANGINLSSHN